MSLLLLPLTSWPLTSWAVWQVADNETYNQEPYFRVAPQALGQSHQSSMMNPKPTTSKATQPAPTQIAAEPIQPQFTSAQKITKEQLKQAYHQPDYHQNTYQPQKVLQYADKNNYSEKLLPTYQPSTESEISPYAQTNSAPKKMELASPPKIIDKTPAPTTKPKYAISVSGSIKDNLIRIMGGYHWKLVWEAPFDYNFDGQIQGESFEEVINKLLEPFPLKASFVGEHRILRVAGQARPDTPSSQGPLTVLNP